MKPQLLFHWVSVLASWVASSNGADVRHGCRAFALASREISVKKLGQYKFSLACTGEWGSLKEGMDLGTGEGNHGRTVRGETCMDPRKVESVVERGGNSDGRHLSAPSAPSQHLACLSGWGKVRLQDNLLQRGKGAFWI